MTIAVASKAPEQVLYKIPEVMAMLRMSRGAVYQEISAGRLRKSSLVLSTPQAGRKSRVRLRTSI